MSKNGIAPSSGHVESTRDYPESKIVKEMQSFLGLCSYFRRFVNGFSLISKSLYDSTKEGVKYKFSDENKQAFEILKGKLMSSSVCNL